MSFVQAQYELNRELAQSVAAPFEVIQTYWPIIWFAIENSLSNYFGWALNYTVEQYKSLSSAIQFHSQVQKEAAPTQSVTLEVQQLQSLLSALIELTIFIELMTLIVDLISI